MAAARAQLHRVIGIAAKPVYSGVARYPLGLPQYRVGHDERIEEMDRALARLPGLHVIGNAFRGIGLNTCTAVAEKTSRDIAEYLGSRHGVSVATPKADRSSGPLTLVADAVSSARRSGSSR